MIPNDSRKFKQPITMLKTIQTHFLRYKWWWLGASLCAIPFAFYWYRILVSNLTVYDVIAPTAAAIVRIDNIEHLSKTTDTISYRDILGGIALTEKAKADFKFLERLMDGEAKILLQQPVTMSIESSSAQTLDFLYLFDATWHRLDLRAIFQKHDIPFKEYTFAGGHTVYTAFFNHDIAFSFAEAKNLIFTARYTSMVEDALSTLDANDGVSTMHKFRQIERDFSSKKYDCTIFCNLKAVPATLTSFIEPSKRATLDKISEHIAWIGTGLDFSKEGISLQGMMATQQQNAYYHALPSSSFHQHQRITEVLPANVATMFWVGTNNFRTFFDKIDTNEEISNYYVPFFGEDAACAITEPMTDAANAEIYAVFRVKDSLLAQKKLHEYEARHGVPFQVSYNTHVIKQIINENVLSCLTGKQLELRDPYYTFVGEYMVFCSSRAGLEVAIDKYLGSQTLANDVLYQEFAQNMGNTSGIYNYINIERIQQVLLSLTIPNIREQVEYQLDNLQKMNYLGLNLIPRPEGFGFYGKWKWTKAKRKKMVASIAWKTLLDSEAVIAPTIANAEDGESQEVLIQDERHQLYIINGSGEIRVKKALEGKILSEIKQINYYNGAKKYYIFNTENKIHLLDYNGNEAQSFPLSLQSAAASGMLIVDFDGSGNYCYFVPTKNGNIYGFERNGKPLGGWNPLTGVGIVEQPMGHFQVGDKDYILALAGKNLHVMRRNGSYRLSPIPLDGVSISPPGYQSVPLSQRMVVATSHGMAHNINLAGESFKIAVPIGDNSQVKFRYADVWGDNRSEYIMLNKNMIVVYGYNGEVFGKVFERKFQDNIDDIQVIKMPDTQKNHIGFVSKNATHVFLMDGIGKVYRNFPLAGTTAFQITDFFGEGIPVLIVANGASVYTYKLK